MKSNEIKFGKQTVASLFQDWYTVPSYQRNFVWGDDQFDDLLEDLRKNSEQHPDNEYFLGSYIKQVKADSNDLLDGQQRITTLFLLFAFLRDYDRTPSASDLQGYVFQKGKDYEDIPDKVRLDYQIRGKVNEFVQDFIVPEGAIKDNWLKIVEKSTKTDENETIRHMCMALCYFQKYFDEHPSLEIKKYLKFILTKVVLIFISADNLDDAFRLFSIMNDRGLKLSNADILKSDNLEAISSAKDIDHYAREWESIQEGLGDDLDRFLMFLRSSLVKARAKVNMLEEYKDNVFEAGILAKGIDFFKKVMTYYDVYKEQILLEQNTDVAYCNLLEVLLASLPSTDWIPVLLNYYEKFKTTDLLAFTKKLACKVVADMVCGDGPSVRIENLFVIMNAIDASPNFAELCASGCFSFDENRFISEVNGNVYGRAFAKPLLMLLENDLQARDVRQSFKQISIEHILPQTPSAGSQWLSDFMDAERTLWTHRIGNLILIGRRKNSTLGNKDYRDKRTLYFQKDIGSFARSLKLYNDYPVKWTVVELKKNQKEVLEQIKRVFGLSVALPKEEDEQQSDQTLKGNAEQSID